MKNVDLISSMVEIDREGELIPAYLARPGTERHAPGILVIHEIFGLVDHIKDVTDRIARQGYVAMAPDLFFRQGLPRDLSTMEARLEFFSKIPDRRVLADLDAALDYLRRSNFVVADRLGIIGFCMGGTYSLMLASHNQNLAAAVVFYGRLIYPELGENKPNSPIDLVRDLKCPLLGIFGEADKAVPVQHVRLLEERLKADKKDYEIKIYPDAPHGFFNDTRENYRPGPAEDAWQKVLAFFSKHLKSR